MQEACPSGSARFLPDKGVALPRKSMERSGQRRRFHSHFGRLRAGKCLSRRESGPSIRGRWNSGRHLRNCTIPFLRCSAMFRVGTEFARCSLFLVQSVRARRRCMRTAPSGSAKFLSGKGSEKRLQWYLQNDRDLHSSNWNILSPTCMSL